MGKASERDGLADRLVSWGMNYLEDTPDSIPQYQDAGFGGGTDAMAAADPSRFEDRGAILAATTKLAVADGYWRLGVSGIRRQAGVSRGRFTAHFEGVEDCYLAAAADLIRSFLSMIVVRADSSRGWAEGVHSAVSGLTRRLVSEPEKARLAFVGVLDPGEKGLLCREMLIGELGAAWQRGATPVKRQSQLSSEATLGAFWNAIANRLDSEKEPDFVADAPTLAYLLLVPSLGPTVACEAIAETATGQMARPG